MAKKPPKTPTTTELMHEILQLRAQLDELSKPARPERRTALAKGSQPKPPSAEALERRIRAEIIERPLSITEAADRLGVTPAIAERALRRLATAGRVTLSSEERGRKRYVWLPDASTTSEERKSIILGLLQEQPRTAGNIGHILRLDSDLVTQMVNDIRRRIPVWLCSREDGGPGRSNVYWVHPDKQKPPPEFDDDQISGQRWRDSD